MLYVEDVERAPEVGGLVRGSPGSFGMRVTLIPFDGVSEVGRIAIDGVTVVARDHAILGAYGGTDRMTEQADILLGRRLA